MTTEEKRYPVTEEIADLFIESQASERCRDRAINSIWGTNRAIRYGKICLSKELDAWKLIRNLYPELTKKNLTYHFENREVRIDK